MKASLNTVCHQEKETVYFFFVVDTKCKLIVKLGFFPLTERKPHVNDDTAFCPNNFAAAHFLIE